MQRIPLLHPRIVPSHFSSTVTLNCVEDKIQHKTCNKTNSSTLLSPVCSFQSLYQQSSSMPVGLNFQTKCKSSNYFSDAELYFSTDVQNRAKMNSTNKVSFDSIGAWDNNFELPLQMEASLQHGKPVPRILSSDVGCQSHLGKRLYQEDRYFKNDLSENLLCCAVFDGHNGSECSSFCVEALEDVLKKNIESADNDLESLLHHSILDLHSMYVEWVSVNKKGEKSGTTCTICLLRNGLDLVVAHVGDSRALLCRRGAPKRLTYDHCPSNITERKRVEQSGGTVATDNIGRHMVNEVLNMSRSIGDLHLKPFGVTALPDTRNLRLKHGHDAFLLLTTDGINFVLNDDEICDVVNHAQDPQTAASALIEQALSNSSEDNVTALVVPLGSWGKFSKSATSMFYSFGIGRDITKSSRFG